MKLAIVVKKKWTLVKFLGAPFSLAEPVTPSAEPIKLRLPLLIWRFREWTSVALTAYWIFSPNKQTIHLKEYLSVKFERQYVFIQEESGVYVKKSNAAQT